MNAADVPERLRVLVEEDRRRPIVQPGVAFDRERWLARLEAHQAVLDELPSRLDRAAGASLSAAHQHGEDAALAVFIASQIWGYGSTNYGPYRLAEALSSPNIGAVLSGARELLRRGQAIEAFKTLCVRNRISWTGTAFGSKYLYFAEPTSGALILDSIVAEWVALHAGCRWRLQRDAREYAAWLELASGWAAALGVTADHVEMLIFTDGLGEDSSWRPEEPD